MPDRDEREERAYADGYRVGRMHGTAVDPTVALEAQERLIAADVEIARLRGSADKALAAVQTEAKRLQGENERLREEMHYHMPQEGYCPACGCYMPRTLDGSERVTCGCDRTPPLDHLPPTIYACPTCGGHGRGRWGCWGTKAHPHEHAYMQPVHELVRIVARERSGQDPSADVANVNAMYVIVRDDNARLRAALEKIAYPPNFLQSRSVLSTWAREALNGGDR